MDTIITNCGRGPSGLSAWVVQDTNGEKLHDHRGRFIFTYDEAVAVQRSFEDARVEEYSGVMITTAPEDAAHVGQIINHIAHLDDAQVDAIRRTLNSWVQS